MDKIHGSLLFCSVGHMLLLIHADKMLLHYYGFGNVHLKSGSLILKPAAISGFAALAADVNHRRDVEQMEAGEVALGLTVREKEAPL